MRIHRVENRRHNMIITANQNIIKARTNHRSQHASLSNHPPSPIYTLTRRVAIPPFHNLLFILKLHRLDYKKPTQAIPRH